MAPRPPPRAPCPWTPAGSEDRPRLQLCPAPPSHFGARYPDPLNSQGSAPRSPLVFCTVLPLAGPGPSLSSVNPRALSHCPQPGSGVPSLLCPGAAAAPLSKLAPIYPSTLPPTTPPFVTIIHFFPRCHSSIFQITPQSPSSQQVSQGRRRGGPCAPHSPSGLLGCYLLDALRLSETVWLNTSDNV